MANNQPKQKLINCNFYITNELYDGINELAKTTQQPKSEHFRRALKLYLQVQSERTKTNG